MFKLLKSNKKFALLLASSSISQFGSFFSYMLLIVLSYERTQSMATTMGITLSSSIGSLLMGFFAGVFIDRISSPKKILITTNVLSAAVIGSLFFLPHHMWINYIAVFLIAVLSSFSLPAFNKVQVTIVDRQNLMNANASLQSIREITKIIAPGAAAFVLSALPNSLKPVGFLIDASTYIIAFFLVLAIQLKGREQRAVEQENQPINKWAKFKQDWIEGWGPFKNPVIANILILYFVLIMGIAGFDVILSAHIFQAEMPTMYVGYILSAQSFGMILSTLITPRFVKNFPISLRLGGSALGIGVFMMGIGGFNQIAIMLGFGFLLGISNAVYNFTAPTYFQENVPESMLGRFFGLVTSIMSVLSILGMSINGVLGSAYSGAFVILLIGGIIAVFGGISIIFISAAEKKEKRSTNSVSAG